MTTRIVETAVQVDEHEQGDGSRFATERHTDNLGRQLTFGPYRLGEGESAQTIAQMRAARLNLEFAARDAEAEQAAQGRLPWTHLDFEDQLGADVVAPMLAFFQSFESSESLSPLQKATIRVGWHRYQIAQYIERPLRAEVLQLLGLLQQLGLITQERIDDVIAAAEA